MATKVNYAVIRLDELEVILFLQDGGIATCHHNGYHIITDYYQDRVTKEMLDNRDTMWDSLADGKMYCHDWESKQKWDEEVVQDMLSWLYVATESVEFVRCELDWENTDAVKKFITEN